MESLQVRTGQVSLQILDDQGNERGIFKFNPTDVHSAKAILSMQDEFNEKQREFEEREAKCQTLDEKVALLNDLVDYFTGLIDNAFGAGTSDLVFGGAKSISMFEDFFTGIIPYYEKASKDRMAKYGVVDGNKQ